jgi:hypothetical protein
MRLFAGILSVSLLLLANRCKKPRVPGTVPTTGPPVSSSPDQSDSNITYALPEIDLRIEPSSINPGESALLTWETRNAQKVTIGPAVGSVDVSGRIRIFPEQTTTYLVEAEGRGGTRSSSVTVDVISSIASSDIFEEDLSNIPLEEQFQAFVKSVFFSFDSAQLSSEAREILDKNVEWL